MLGWFGALTLVKKVLLGIGALGAATIAGATVFTPPPSNPETTTPPPKVQQDVVEVKEESIEEAIPFISTTQNDSSLEVGKTIISVNGVNGVKTIIYKVTTTNGVETSREKISELITTQPVNQVTRIGTKVAQPDCPNGTYVNSVGNTVCRPYSSSSAPAGASAQCRDGTYSFSQSRSGTCSHHGGVAQWL